MTKAPDFLEAEAPQTKRPTKAGAVIVFGFMVLAIGLLYVGYHQRMSQTYREAPKEEEVAITMPSPPPVKPEDVKPRPDEPDMMPSPEMRMNNSVPSGPGKMPEYLRNRLEEDRAASQSPMRIAAFDKSGQAQRQQPSTVSDEKKGNEEKPQDFFSADNDEPRYSLNRRTDPIARGMELTRGTLIPGVMPESLNSDLPGQIRARVAENVYDSATGRNLLIPAGAKLYGVYENSIAFGQSRLLVAWQEIEFPDGSYLRLGRMPGVDAGGSAGIVGDVNNHYGRIFGTAVFMSLFSAASQLTQPRNSGAFGGYNAQQILAAAMGRDISMAGLRFLQRELNIQPTIEIPVGTKFNVAVSQAVVFDRVWGEN